MELITETNSRRKNYWIFSHKLPAFSENLCIITVLTTDLILNLWGNSPRCAMVTISQIFVKQNCVFGKHEIGYMFQVTL
jgi:hypothetical protein